MPGPVVYVVVAIVGAVATGYVFKEFVYDPHIAPMIRDWKEQRRTHRSPRQSTHSPIPTTSGYRRRRSPTPSRDPSSLELGAMLANEVDEWNTSANIRHRQTNNVLDDGVPSEIEHPLLSPSTSLARNPPRVFRPPPNEPTHPSQRPLSPPMSLSIPNLASFATDVDYTASSVDATPLAQTAVLRSNLTSPQLTITSPFSDIFELAPSLMSETDIVRVGFGSDDDIPSVPPVVSTIVTDDEDDGSSLGSGESWHDIRDELNRS